MMNYNNFIKSRNLATKTTSSSSSAAPTTSSSSSTSVVVPVTNTTTNITNSTTEDSYIEPSLIEIYPGRYTLNETYKSDDCYSCYEFDNSRFCNNNNLFGYCCLDSDTSINCTTNSKAGIECSDTYDVSQNLFLGYCIGTTPEKCGTNSLSLTADSEVKYVTAQGVTLFENSTVQNYSACYWHISLKPYYWFPETLIHVKVNA